ncbi:GMP synthase [glutamine-hydrolyzing], amidotransferase subunit / GMP synthase [glutamine-hydrolyzing], ATP pyrophosphatase subunit [hydrothermal vent metagenome]|uniref:GMP synthase (glutamine-hydrolyzing) n=1 Tax=hydrothermal vent metagenome TaxID=652676 RepID=A0A3B1D9V8_9ZZZZ
MAKKVKKVVKKVVTKKSVPDSMQRIPGLKTRVRVNPKKRMGKLPKLKKVKGRMAASVKVRKVRTKDVILVLDFGSQYTQLIARRVRENKVYSKILPYNVSLDEIKELNPKGIILSGGPVSVYDKKAPEPDKGIFELNVPILGICYGMQVITKMFGGKVKSSKEREFGRAELFVDSTKDLFLNLPTNITCWMSHSDELKTLPKGFAKVAHTLNAPIAAFANRTKKIFGVQFHPEVVHTQRGTQVLNNFVFTICGCLPRWTMGKFIDATIKQIKEQVGDKKVILGLSGGVDSSVTAVLLQKAIGRNLQCIFVNNGLLRKNEVATVQKTFKGNFKMNLTCIDAEKKFLKRLEGIEDPEEKRKIIGDEFVRVFEEKAKKFKRADFLAQGTLYPDVIESISPTGGPSDVIKSHHNVGGIPEDLNLKLIEPFRELFKDEVRAIGKHMGVPEAILKRQPFPGPGLAIRIIGEITKERLELLREADERVLEEIKKAGLYEEIWQSFAVLLPIKTVGVMGDQRTYENVVALRCVNSVDGMTADWAKLPHDLLGKISNRIINEVKGVNRVVYDISSKPPATIEWE